MENRQKSTHSYSLINKMKLSIIGAVLIIIVNFIISIFSIIDIKQQNTEATVSAITQYHDKLLFQYGVIKNFIQWTIVNEPLLQTIESADNPYVICQTSEVLRTQITNTQSITDNAYQYFVYLENQDYFFNASKLNYSYSDYLTIKEYVISAVKSHSFESNEQSWQLISLNDTTYLYYLINYYNRTIVTVIDIKDLIVPLEKIILGKNGGVTVKDMDGKIIYHTGAKAETCQRKSFFCSQQIFHGSGYSLPFDVIISYDNFYNLGTVFFFQIFIIFIALGLCIMLANFILNLYYKVIKPIQEFSNTFASINDHHDSIDFQSNNIRELEQVNVQFKNLMHEIRRLKINIYEQELDKKRFEITFLQNQIRPHFYLNCLTTISSMAQLHRYDDIVSMVLFTSRYLRYLFQTDKEMLPIEYELTHIEAYLDIQALRFGCDFHYTCTIEESDKHALIPPLLLITFIENTIKHSNTDIEQLHISLEVKQTRKDDNLYLQIDITDSGQGFPQAVLDKLTLGESLNTATQQHVGIANSIQRLALLYGTNQKLHFFNESHGGAHIQLLIPYQTQEDRT